MYKPQSVRLIDILNILSNNDTVTIIFRSGRRETKIGLVKDIRQELEGFLGCTITTMVSGNETSLMLDDR